MTLQPFWMPWKKRGTIKAILLCKYIPFQGNVLHHEYRDKTEADKFMYISYENSQNYPFCTSKLVVETFGHSTYWTNHSKFSKSPEGCWAKKLENVL